MKAIPVEQWEAAYALGYTRYQAFWRFVFPQAVRIILPVYRGLVISLVKDTSIVGYITIHDLTKVGNLIRARTYNAFFPLVSTAIIQKNDIGGHDLHVPTLVNHKFSINDVNDQMHGMTDQNNAMLFLKAGLDWNLLSTLRGFRLRHCD